MKGKWHGLAQSRNYFFFNSILIENDSKLVWACSEQNLFILLFNVIDNERKLAWAGSDHNLVSFRLDSNCE